MTRRLPLALVLLLAGITLGACDNNSNNNGGTGGMDPMTPRSTTEIVNAEIQGNTNETAEPILLNDLPVDDDRSETAEPSPL